MLLKQFHQDYFRSFIFGCQDALVSTTGIIVGINAAVDNYRFVLLSAIVAVFVEATSMAAGQYLSEKSVHDLPNARHHDNLLLGSLVMFFSYIFGGTIPVIPLLFTPSLPVFSIIFPFFGLFFLGFVKGKLFTGHPGRSSFEMLLIGGIAILVGLFLGFIFRV